MHTPIIDGKVKVVGIPDFPWICGDELCFVFRNFPLTKIRPHAYETALAAEAAAAQGKFWGMYDYLFKHGQMITNDSLMRSAASLGLNLTKFDSEFYERMYSNHIDEDI